MTHLLAVLSLLALGAFAGQSVPQPIPQAVNGWREYPLRDGVVSIQPAKWRTDTIDVPVPGGKGLEFPADVVVKLELAGFYAIERQ